MNASPSSLVALAAGVAIIAVSLTVGFGSDGCAKATGGDARRHIPSDAHGAVVVTELEQTRAAGASFLAGVEGASGLFELLQARYGVSLDTPEGLVAAGLDPAGSLAVFTVASPPLAKGPKGSTDAAKASVAAPTMVLAPTVVVAMSVSDAVAWRTLLRGRATLTGTTVQAGAQLTVAIAPDGKDGVGAQFSMGWGVTSSSVGMVLVAPAGADIKALWERLQAPLEVGDSFLGTAAASDAQALSKAQGIASIWVAGNGVVPFPAGQLPALIESSVKALVQAPEHWAAAVGISGERISVRARGDVPAAKAELPTGWFKTPKAATPFEAVLPRMSTAMARTQTGLRSLLSSVPSFLLDRFLPEQTPSLDGLPLPAPSRLIELANGDFCVALLGLDTDEPLTLLADPRARAEELLQLAHVAIGIGVNDTAKMRRYLHESAQRAREAGFAVARVGSDVEGIFAHSFVSRRKLPGRRGPTVPRTYALVLSETHNVLFLITGRGEVQRFIDVAAGRAFALKDVDTSLAGAKSAAAGAANAQPPASPGASDVAPSAAAASQTTIAASALRGNSSHLSGFAVPTRIARELADKGVPPFFLKMLSDLHLLALEVELKPRRVTLALDVLL